jgi:hypothetical protein
MYNNTCRVSVGRLIELRIQGFETPEDVDQFADRVKAQLTAFSSERRAVLIADWRRCPVLPPAIAERVVAMLSRNAPVIERNALWHATDQSTSLLQLFRVVQEAANAQRRVFTDPAALERFLAELLDEAELTRLREFLAESSFMRPSL